MKIINYLNFILIIVNDNDAYKIKIKNLILSEYANKNKLLYDLIKGIIKRIPYIKLNHKVGDIYSKQKNNFRKLANKMTKSECESNNHYLYSNNKCQFVVYMKKFDTLLKK